MATERRIVITNGQFPTTDVEQSDEVFWFNSDTVAHWPVPWCTGLKMAAGQSSAGFQTFPGNSGIVPQKIQYTCALHPTEIGILNVFGDFALAKAPYSGAARTNIQITVGGKSPYDTSGTVLPAGVTLAEKVPGSCNGFGAVATAAGTYTFTLNATDGLGVAIQQQLISVTVS